MVAQVTELMLSDDVPPVFLLPTACAYFKVPHGFGRTDLGAVRPEVAPTMRRQGAETILAGPGLLVPGFPGHYGHWLSEELPQILLFLRVREVAAAKVFVASRDRTVLMMAEALQLFVPEERVAWLDMSEPLMFRSVYLYSYPEDCKRKKHLSSFQRPFRLVGAVARAFTPVPTNYGGPHPRLLWVSKVRQMWAQA